MIPGRSDVIPRRSNVIPMTSNGIPNISNVIPRRSNVIPGRSNVIPGRSNVIPGRFNTRAEALVFYAPATICSWGILFYRSCRGAEGDRSTIDHRGVTD